MLIKQVAPVFVYANASDKLLAVECLLQILTTEQLIKSVHTFEKGALQW